MPPMSLFTPPNVTGSSKVAMESEAVAGIGSSREQEVINVLRIRRIVGLNSFQPQAWSESDAGATSSLSAALQQASGSLLGPEGLWVLPSLINHSCAPNCLWLHVGSAMFVRSLRRLPAGEEVTIAYANVHLPIEERTEYFRSRNCCCACARCAF